MLECVVNISEGRRPDVVEAIGAAAGADLLDVHTDAHHNRSVLTLLGVDAPRAVAAEAVARLDLRSHQGVHPRIGVVDVVPFVALGSTPAEEAVAARDGFGAWAADVLGVPGFAYGPERTLPDVRRQAFDPLVPTWGGPGPHPTAGAIAVGARPLLVAYNLWLAPGTELAVARRIARAVRSPEVRTLGLAVGAEVQVSMNLVAPLAVGPAAAWDAVADHAGPAGTAIARAELVGLVPEAVMERAPEARWEQLDLGPDRTIEGRVARRR